jgi:hypothetical protein
LRAAEMNREGPRLLRRRFAPANPHRAGPPTELEHER